MRLREFASACLVLTCLSLAGCGNAPEPKASTDDHDHEHDNHGHEHAHAESFAEAVKQVEQLHAKIKTALEADDLDNADGPVHEIGHLLEELAELAAKDSLPDADQEQVKQAVESLMDGYGAIDERIHGGESKGKSYGDVSESIDTALAKLKSIGKQESAP